MVDRFCSVKNCCSECDLLVVCARQAAICAAVFFCCERLSASMARSLHLSFICIPQSTRALDQGGVEPRQAVSPKALRPWTIPLRYSVGSAICAAVGCAPEVPEMLLDTRA